MCRWIAYSGSPVLLDQLLLKPAHSLIIQSLHSRLGATTTNGDGFGIGWYGVGDTPGVFHSTEPAWNDRNLKDLAQHIVSPLVFAHIRASTGTDSKLFFYLALTFGLQEDPPAAVERAVGFIEQTGRAKGVEHPIQMTVATTDGASVWVFRYSSEGNSRSLFYSTALVTLRAQYPDDPVLHQLSDETRLVVSEPLRDLVGAWNEVPESTCGIVQEGQDELRAFTPRLA